MNSLGKKIVIVGVSASGKSTLARALSEKTGIPVTFMDSIMWKPGWVYVGDDETNKALEEITSGDTWLLESYITKGSFANVFERVETIIYLDYPRYVAFLRYIKRWWQHRENPREEIPGCPEKLNLEFAFRIWKKVEVSGLNEFLRDSSYESKILRFQSVKETKDFLKNL